MTQDQWNAVDQYIDEHLVGDDPTLSASIRAADDAGLPPINVAPNQGKLLHLLALAQGARSILEIGTLAGYSTIWLARALPADGSLVTIEADPAHADVARSSIADAGVADIVDVRVGKALDTLPVLAEEGAGPFDLVFIDADKANNPSYVDWALRLTRRGSVIIVDNVVRGGRVIDATTEDASTHGTRRLFEQLSTEPRVSATAVQTVGSKGHDGFLLAVVMVDP
ncbi:putative O-methyltransferase YrrM [Haloactinopolyspora alba]|uniref:Putative O-methyltransferase YrrM n=1 Tax=Haloactinopolyspora alba TaxID=648780 RepID=A0A2P8EGJ4_9ACTN|nr:O-methyltransferase [Haloactinopolyspora alba]PSL08562.1 putative O-methyltransferase YrrM [Haloactinopolyspora alba]